MNIDGVTNGIVLDHITAGKGFEIYKKLDLDELDCCVALIKNVKSIKMGCKDIIKIDTELDIDLEVLGFIDPTITVNYVKDGVNIDKKRLHLPKKLKNVIKCKNPRCITTTEQEVEQVFVLSDEAAGLYRCKYCETAYTE